MDHNGVTGTNGPKDSIMGGQQSTAKKFKLSHNTEHSPEESPPHPHPLIKSPEKNLPRQKGSNGGIIPQPNPIYEKGPPKENLEILQTPLLIALPHRPQKPGGRAKWKGQ